MNYLGRIFFNQVPTNAGQAYLAIYSSLFTSKYSIYMCVIVCTMFYTPSHVQQNSLKAGAAVGVLKQNSSDEF